MCNAHNHPPGCTCGWGGEGHAGHRSDGWSYIPPTNYWTGSTGEWRERDFTRPTICPECGQEVFFIRHNGGSVWVDPPLGWPWPKHPCFDKPNEPTRTFSSWSPKSARLTNPQLGIITGIKTNLGQSEPVIEIRLTDSSFITLVPRWIPHDNSLPGSLVFISEEDRLLLHQVHAEIPFHSLRRLSLANKGWYTCPRCKAWVKAGTGHEEHCRKHYGRPKAAKDEPIPLLRAVRPTKPWAGKPPKKKPVVIYSARPRHRHHPVPPPSTGQAYRITRMTLQDRIRQAVESIAKQAWETAASVTPTEEQLRAAKHKALELIARLSPSIKRQVGDAFTSQKWSLLLSHRPKN